MSAALSEDSMPLLRRGIRHRYDEARARFILLGPERVVVLDEIGNAILAACDGRHDIATISRLLARRYAADEAQVARDVTAFIRELLDKGLMTA